MRRFDVLIFDWDGTLFDSVDWIVDCLRQAAVECNIPEPAGDAARSVIGLGLHEAMQTLFPDEPAARLQQLMECYRRRYFDKEIGPSDLFDGVIDTLTQLRERGYRLAIATGKSRSGLDRAMQGTGTFGLFGATRCADETESKSHPAMIREILACLGADTRRAVMIGDTTHDLLMAANAGIAGIAVDSGAHSRAALAALNPLACLTNVNQLPTIV